MLLIAIIVPKHLKQFLCIAAGILYLNGVRLFITTIIINIFLEKQLDTRTSNRKYCIQATSYLASKSTIRKSQKIL